jgi:hypothetical protein
MAFTGTMSYEGEHQPPQTTIDAAIQCADQLRAQKDAWMAPRLVQGFSLSDGSQAYVLDLEDTWRVHIVAVPEGYEGEEHAVTRHDAPISYTATIAGMLSGGMNVTTLEYKAEREPPGLYIREDRFSLMRDSSRLFSVEEASYKLGVPEDSSLAVPRGGSPHIYNQFATVEPGNYTGAMSHIVQLLLGVGNILDYDYEQRWINADPKRRAPITTHTVELDIITQEREADPGPATSFYTGQGNKRVQITYDWRWNRTHGIMWGRTNRSRRQAMLVELGQRGVYVMPFPVDELSTRADVQAQYLRVYPGLDRYSPFEDGEKTLFEAIGGFPTGENIPGGTDKLERWIRAGYLLDGNHTLPKFYEGSPMCVGFGWAFHPRGSRAINTMYIVNDKGQKVGYCYEVRLNIQEKAAAQQTRNTVTETVIGVLGLTDKVDKYKAARLPQGFAEALIESPDYASFDAFVVDPDWIVQVQEIKLREGFLEFPGIQCTGGPAGPCGVIKRAPHFKFFEPILGRVEHFHFSTERNWGRIVPEPSRSDGPIFATYVNGSPEILHMFHDYTTPSTTTYNTRQPCQFVGSWTDGFSTEGGVIAGQFYTTSRDFRKPFSYGAGSILTTSASIAGSYDFVNFCAVMGQHGMVTKHYVGRSSFNGKAWFGREYSVSVMCAANNRSMFFVCHEDVVMDSVTSSGSGGGDAGASGAVRYVSIYNFLAHWIPCPSEHSPEAPPCYMASGPVVVTQPGACMGTGAPASFTYSVCCLTNGRLGADCYPWSTVIVSSPLNNAVIYSAALSRVPTIPPGHSTGTQPSWEYKYEVWAFGHPLMHNVRIRKGAESITDPEGWAPSLSHQDWWICTIPGMCDTYPWRVTANYYGPPYVGTNEEHGFGWVEAGARPRGGAIGLFGVVY